MVSTATLAMSFAVLWFGRSSIVWIVVGVILLDVGVQGTQVLNQSVIYGLSPSAQSRVNSVYMTTYFVGGAGGSAVAGAAYDRGGWGSVCILGASMGRWRCCWPHLRPGPRQANGRRGDLRRRRRHPCGAVSVTPASPPADGLWRGSVAALGASSVVTAGLHSAPGASARSWQIV